MPRYVSRAFRPFQAGSAPGVPPSRLFPSAEPLRLSAPVALLPLSTFGSAAASRGHGRPRQRTRLQGFAPRGSPSRLGRGLVARTAGAPLGFTALGRSGFAWRPASRALPSRASRAAARTADPRAPQGIDPRAGGRNSVDTIRGSRRRVPQPFCGSRASSPHPRASSRAAPDSRRRVRPHRCRSESVHGAFASLPEGSRRECRRQARAVVRPSKASIPGFAGTCQIHVLQRFTEFTGTRPKPFARSGFVPLR